MIAYTAGFMTFIYIALFWEMVWKGIALWKSGRRNQLTWFVFLFLFNTLGILPIIYLLVSKDKAKPEAKKKVVKKK